MIGKTIRDAEKMWEEYSKDLSCPSDNLRSLQKNNFMDGFEAGQKSKGNVNFELSDKENTEVRLITYKKHVVPRSKEFIIETAKYLEEREKGKQLDGITGTEAITQDGKKKLVRKFNEKRNTDDYLVEILQISDWTAEDETKLAYGVNYACRGTLNMVDAKEFVKQLNEAIELCKKLNDEVELCKKLNDDVPEKIEPAIYNGDEGW